MLAWRVVPYLEIPTVGRGGGSVGADEQPRVQSPTTARGSGGHAVTGQLRIAVPQFEPGEDAMTFELFAARV
jgi:hypothetical protein